MSEIISRQVNGETVSFFCSFRDRRGGFAHDAELMLDGRPTGVTASVNYINRTWERYEYQTVCQRIAREMMRRNEEAARAGFMAARGWRRMTKARAVEFAEYLKDSENWAFWNAVRCALA